MCDLGSLFLKRLIWEDFVKDLDVQEANLFQFRPRGCRSFGIWFHPKLALKERVSLEEIENSDPFWCSAESLRRQWQPTPVLLPGKSHGLRSLVGCSPWGCYELDMTEGLPFHFSLSCIGEGNGNPLQCSCLENPRDGGAWWAAVYGVAQSRTRPKQLSSSRIPHTSLLSILAWDWTIPLYILFHAS